MKINQRLVLGFITIALSIGAVGYISINMSQRVLQKTIGENSVALLAEVMDKIDRNIYSKIESFQSFKESILQETIIKSNQEFEKIDNVQNYINKKDQEWISVPEEEITPFMKDLINNRLSEELRRKTKFYAEKQGFEVYSEVFIANKYGVNVAQTGKTTDYRQDDEKWWQGAKEDGLYVEDVELDRSSGVYSISVGIRIDDGDGNFIGAMKVVLNIEEVVRIIKSLEASRQYLTRKIKMITVGGRLIYPIEEFEFLEDVSDELVLRYGLTKYPTHKLYLIRTDANGKEKLFVHVYSRGYRDFEGLGWILTAEYEREEIFAPIIKLRNILLLISFVMTILAILLGLYISYSISNPIAKLKSVLGKIGKGNLNYKVGMTSKDEIGQLSRAFDKMTDDLKQTTTSIATLKEEIIARRETEEKLKAAKQQIEFVLGATKTGIDIIDSDFNIVYIDSGSQKKYGDYKGKKCYAYYANRDKACLNCELLQALKTRKPVIKEKALPKEGNRFIQVTTIPFQNEKGEWFAAEVNVDITERKKVQEQLSQSEKMASLGRLSAGIAHEIKNPLAIILQSVAYLKSKLFSDAKINDVIKMAEQSVLKSNTIIEDLLHFARQTPPVFEKTDISSIIEDAILLVKYQVKNKNIEIVKQYHETCSVNIDTRQIQQVFINVLLNAIDAIDNKGTITISLKQVKDVQNYIQVIFTDSGCGVSKKHLQNIFDPFFSTKQKKGNAGLGLSISEGIVEIHKGTITIDSQVGTGTSVIISLPIY